MGNVRAMQEAILIGSSDRQLTTADITSIHRSLLWDDQSEIAGHVRTVQNWIVADSVVPSTRSSFRRPSQVPALLDDLVAFVNREDLLQLYRPRSLMPSSRQFTPSATATAALALPHPGSSAASGPGTHANSAVSLVLAATEGVIVA